MVISHYTWIINEVINSYRSNKEVSTPISFMCVYVLGKTSATLSVAFGNPKHQVSQYAAVVLGNSGRVLYIRSVLHLICLSLYFLSVF